MSKSQSTKPSCSACKGTGILIVNGKETRCPCKGHKSKPKTVK